MILLSGESLWRYPNYKFLWVLVIITSRFHSLYISSVLPILSYQSPSFLVSICIWSSHYDFVPKCDLVCPPMVSMQLPSLLLLWVLFSARIHISLATVVWCTLLYSLHLAILSFIDFSTSYVLYHTFYLGLLFNLSSLFL